MTYLNLIRITRKKGARLGVDLRIASVVTVGIRASKGHHPGPLPSTITIKMVDDRIRGLLNRIRELDPEILDLDLVRLITEIDHRGVAGDQHCLLQKTNQRAQRHREGHAASSVEKWATHTVNAL